MIVCICFVSLPLGYLMPFCFGLGTEGLLIGYGIGLFLAGILFAILLLRQDWQAIADEIQNQEFESFSFETEDKEPE